MNKQLTDIIIRTGIEYKDQVLTGSRFYIEVDIGKQAEKYGYPGLKGRYQDIYAIIPLKRPASGMKVRIDGRTFVNYVEFESGIAVPNFVGKEVNLSHKSFTPNDSMILNFT